MWRNLTIMGVLAGVMGCDRGPTIPLEHSLNPDLSRQVAEAIAAINEFGRVVDRTPENLRLAANKVIDKLVFDQKDFLAHAARDFTDKTLGRGGAIAKGTIEFADRKMKAYLEALKKALEEALPKVNAEKARDKAVSLLQNIKVEIKPLDPFVELASPTPLTFTFLKSDKGKLRSVEYTSGRILELSGRGLLRPDGEPTKYRIEVGRAEGEPRRVLYPSVSPAGPFVATVNLDDLAPAETDQELRLYWGDQKLAHVGFAVRVTKDPPPIPPKVTTTPPRPTSKRGTLLNDAENRITYVIEYTARQCLGPA